jgi:deferrochelatase/peroxidase EfeB
MLELDDIQGLSVSGYGMPHARFLFLRIHTPNAGREWIKRLTDHVTTARPWTEPPRSCVNVGFTHTGLKALGVAQESLDSFEKEFREGIAARAEVLGDTGKSSPQNWPGGLGTDDLHAILLLFAQDAAALEEESQRQRGLLQIDTGVEELSAQDAAALPTGREHFGYRDGITHVLIEGDEKQLFPGQTLIKAGEFVLGYPDESGTLPPQPQPDVLGRNGSFLVYRKLHQDVAGWRRFIREEADKLKMEPELLSAKLMGRWRSGAPLVLSPKEDDPALANDPQRNGG